MMVRRRPSFPFGKKADDVFFCGVLPSSTVAKSLNVVL